MANAYNMQIVEEGPRNAVVKLVGILDTANASLASVIELSDFTNNEPRKTLNGLRLMRLDYAMSDALSVILEWSATTDQLIAVVSGRGQLCLEDISGTGPNRGAAGYDGAIDLATVGWASGTQVYTLILKFRKLYAS